MSSFSDCIMDKNTDNSGVEERDDIVSSSSQPLENRPVFARGFSMANPEMVSNLHEDIKMKCKDSDADSYGYFRDMTLTRFSFTLPEFSNYNKQFVEFLIKELIENSTLKSLEESGHLNWWVKNNHFQRLLPLATSGDGNCLLHAASLGIWGVHDRLLNLRQAMHRTLTSALAETTIKRRWHLYQWGKNIADELVFSDEEWEKEWQLVLSLAAPKPRSSLRKSSLSTVPEVDDHNDDGNAPVSKRRSVSTVSEPQYESLEEIHVFALAHALQRPIIVVADTVLKDFDGNAMFPIPFGGVYLPVECDPTECCRVPLILAYSFAHFSPVVATERHEANEESDGRVGDRTSTVQVVIPLVDKFLEPLPLPFSADPGNHCDNLNHENSEVLKEKCLTPDERMALLRRYLDVVYVNMNFPPARQNETPQEGIPKTDGSDVSCPKPDDFASPVPRAVAVAVLPRGKQPDYYKKLIAEYIEKAKERFDFDHEMKGSLPSAGISNNKCASDGCDLYGTVANNYLCTKCFQVQSNSSKAFQPTDIAGKNETWADQPPADDPPPSYSEAVGDKRVFYPPSFAATCSSSSERAPDSMIPRQCEADGCTFYGTANRNGFCSKCFNK